MFESVGECFLAGAHSFELERVLEAIQPTGKSALRRAGVSFGGDAFHDVSSVRFNSLARHELRRRAKRSKHDAGRLEESTLGTVDQSLHEMDPGNDRVNSTTQRTRIKVSGRSLGVVEDRAIHAG